MEPEYVSKNVTIVNKIAKPSGGAYFLGFIGALIYFMQTAVTFGDGVIGFLKALVWPGVLVYYLFKHLGI